LTPDGYHLLAEKFFDAIRTSVASQPIPSAMIQSPSTVQSSLRRSR